MTVNGLVGCCDGDAAALALSQQWWLCDGSGGSVMAVMDLLVANAFGEKEGDDITLFHSTIHNKFSLT